MNRRAATALRFLAVIAGLQAIKTVVFVVLRESLMRAFESHSGDTEKIVARLQSISTISTWLLFGLLAFALVALIMLATALERNRALVVVAIGMLLAYVSYLIYEQTHPLMGEPKLGQEMLWVAVTATSSIGGMLPLIAVAREKRGWASASLVISGSLLIAMLPVALDAIGIFSQMHSHAWMWAYRIVDVAYAAWFVVFALQAVRVLQEEAADQPAVAAAGTLDPSALRTIGWAILARVGIGFAIAVGTMIATMHGSYDTLTSAAIGSTVISVITTLFLLGGLASYARYPASQRSDGLYIVIGLLVIAVILDVVTAKTTATLYGLADQAQHADSMWSMPSISDMEAMQATIAWTGRISLVLGLVSMLVLLGSLATTARSVGAPELASSAGVTMALAIVATFGAIFIMSWMQTVKRSDESTLIGAGLLLLLVAVFALINLLRVLFGVASAIERPTIPGADPLPEARVVER